MVSATMAASDPKRPLARVSPHVRRFLIAAFFFPLAATAEYCGMPEVYMEALGNVRDAISEVSDKLGVDLTNSGAVVIRWNMSEMCRDAAESSDVFEFEMVLDQCFLIQQVEMTGDEAIKVAEGLRDEMPESMTVIGWAVSDATDEYGYPKMYSRLFVPGFPILDFDQNRDPIIQCLDEEEIAIDE